MVVPAQLLPRDKVTRSHVAAGLVRLVSAAVAAASREKLVDVHPLQPATFFPIDVRERKEALKYIGKQLDARPDLLAVLDGGL